MKLNTSKILSSSFIIAAAASMLVACNKDLPQAEPIVPPAPTGSSIIEAINTDPNLSILKAAINRAGTTLTTLLSDKSGVYTFFAPTNTAFAGLGITNEAMLAGFRPGQLDTLLKYYLVGGQKLTTAAIADSFTTAKKPIPNLQLPSSFVLQNPSPSLPPGFRMSIFPSKRGSNLWVNTIPLVQTDINAANGVIHTINAIALPPQQTIKGIIASDPTNFSLLSAAIARADSGQVGLNRIDSALNYPPANLTLFAPTNDAFRALFPPGTPDAVIIGAINTPALFTAQTVRGLVAYHLLGYRYFSVNFPATPTPINTQLAIPGTPPTIVPVIVSNGATFFVKGLANATPSNVTVKDKNAVNGVVHVIDQVLKPQ